jgi:hypothetical protein
VKWIIERSAVNNSNTDTTAGMCFVSQNVKEKDTVKNKSSLSVKKYGKYISRSLERLKKYYNSICKM